ncbi:MAG: DUF1893 domain-containing protein [Paramuribaculum sp.]|nr:DUF1893 domain-containing protein [Paramuribaculum sp.]
MEIAALIETLHKGNFSCVIYNHGAIMDCRERGVKDLLYILNTCPATLNGAIVADKVVGKGAAAIMIVGGVRKIHAEVLSKPALNLLSSTDIIVSYAELVENIINRSGTGICPIEELCKECRTAEECIPFINQFVESQNK